MYDEIINLTNSALQSIPNLPTLYAENISGAPTMRDPYMRTTLIPSEPFQISRGSQRLLQYSGLIQVDYFMPKTLGSTNPSVDAIIKYFNSEVNRLLSPDMQVMVLRAWRGTSTVEDNWYKTPVMLRLQWFAE